MKRIKKTSFNMKDTEIQNKISDTNNLITKTNFNTN